MKKLASLLSLLILIFNFNSKILVLCDQINYKYARIITDDCNFYADASLKIVKFQLPESFFVKIVSIGTEASRVIYMDGNLNYPLSEGYVKNIDLSFYEGTPEIIYPNLNLTVICDEIIFADNNLSQPKAVIPIGANPIFYGTLTIAGVDYLYVYTNGYIGYMKTDCFAPYVIPYEEYKFDNVVDQSTTLDQTTSLHSPTDKDKEKFTRTDILIIGVLIIGGLSLMFFVLKLEKKKPNDKYIDFDQ